MSFHIPDSEIRRLTERYAPSQPVMEATGFYMVQLTKDRFVTQGASGGAPWIGKKMKAWGYDDGRATLTGASGALLDSFQGYGLDNQAVCFSDVKYSKTHQLGTIGKGGILPTIVPKKAKALFIPITDRAINSERLSGQAAATFRLGQASTSKMPSESPIRVGVKTVGYKPGKSLGRLVFSPLKMGRLHDGKLQVQDKLGQWADGTPDFIFLRKVDTAPRPMLPSGNDERQKIVTFFADSLAHQPRQSKRI